MQIQIRMMFQWCMVVAFGCKFTLGGTHFHLLEENNFVPVFLRNVDRGMTVSWYGPATTQSTRSFCVVLTDAYRRTTHWDVTQYTENTAIYPQFTDVVAVTGNHGNGEYFLRIANMTQFNEGLYFSEVTLYNGTTLPRQNIVLQIKDKHKLQITFDPSSTIREGNDIKICCSSKSLVSHQFLRWFVNGKEKETREAVNRTCLSLTNISRTDYKTYACLVEGGTAQKQATVNVLYPPTLNIWHSLHPETNRISTLRCKADGNPSTYTYKKWEHLSSLKEHIRYIDSPGIIQFAPTSQTNWNRDIGFYVCSVSNGIPYTDGALFKTATKKVPLKGPPVFVAENNHLQFIEEGDPMVITATVFNISTLIHTACKYAAGKENGTNVTTDITLTQTSSWDIIYGKKIMVRGTEMAFLVHNGTFGRFIITACDVHGCNFIEIEFQQFGVHLYKVIVITIAITIGAWFVLGVIVFVVYYALVYGIVTVAVYQDVEERIDVQSYDLNNVAEDPAERVAAIQDTESISSTDRVYSEVWKARVRQDHTNGIACQSGCPTVSSREYQNCPQIVRQSSPDGIYINLHQL